MSKELRDKLREAEEEVERVKHEIRKERWNRVVAKVKEFVEKSEELIKDGDKIRSICDIMDRNTDSRIRFYYHYYPTIKLNGVVHSIQNHWVIEVHYENSYLYDVVSFFEEANLDIEDECYFYWDELDRILNDLEDIL